MVFCVTVGKGMQPFAVKQLELISCDIEGSREGKVSFSCDCMQKLRDLKCVERVFVEIASVHFDRISTNKRELFDMLFKNCEASAIEVAFEMAKKFQQSSNCSNEINFRISTRASGKWRRKIDCDKLSASLARQLKRCHCKWKSLLRGSIQFEICVHISDGHIFIGVPLTRVPLSSRPYLLRNALRSTVCDAMLSLANIQPGMFVVDFTCGSSSILVQAAHDLAGKCFLLGCDVREESLRMSAENRDHLRSYDANNYTIELLAADVKHDYLRLECIDRIVCDLPFGQNYGNEEDSLEILKSVINILSRCSAGCEAVLLIAASQQPIVGSILPSNVLLESVYPISLGTTLGTLIKLTHKCEQNIATNNSSNMVNV